MSIGTIRNVWLRRLVLVATWPWIVTLLAVLEVLIAVTDWLRDRIIFEWFGEMLQLFRSCWKDRGRASRSH